MLEMMDQRIRKALTRYDTASEKYDISIYKLGKAREEAGKDGYKKNVEENPLVKKCREKVQRYEEKMTRAAATLYYLTEVMMALSECNEDSKQIILGDEYDEEDD